MGKSMSGLCSHNAAPQYIRVLLKMGGPVLLSREEAMLSSFAKNQSTGPWEGKTNGG
jgi:hypothetical protein